jgi:hypothetical protein
MTAQQHLARRLALKAASLPGERTLTAQVRAAAERYWRGVDKQKCI